MKLSEVTSAKIKAFCGVSDDEDGMLEICAIWADLQITDSGFGNYCRPILCCYASASVLEDE